MSEPGGIEAWLRAMARELDVDDIARSAGLDPDQARQWVDRAAEWVGEQLTTGDRAADTAEPQPGRSSTRAVSGDVLGGVRPHPLDVPTEEQGLALAALDSGRWTIEPGTSALAARGDGPGPSDALGLVRELRVRDWLDADGELTLAGGRALSRWLEAAERP